MPKCAKYFYSHKNILHIHKLEFVRFFICLFIFFTNSDMCMQFLFHMHTKSDIQLQAVKLFADIISQAQNVKDPYLLPCRVCIQGPINTQNEPIFLETASECYQN